MPTPADWLALGPWRLVHLWYLGWIVGVAGWVIFGEQRRAVWADRETAWGIWHWFTGGPLETDRASEPRGAWRRAWTACWRTALAVGTVGYEYVRSGAPAGTGALTVARWSVAGTAILATSPVVIAWVAVRTAHHLRWVVTLHLAVCTAAGWGELGGEGKKLERAINKRPRKYLTVPRDLERGGDGVIVMCAPWFAPRATNRDAVDEIVRAKLGFGGDVSCTWVQRGRHNYAQFRPREPIREVAPFAEHQQVIEDESTPATIVLGLTRGDRPVKVDLARESPHFLMSAGTGGGKSTMLTLVAAQLMWHGAEPWVADYKRHSLRWLRDLPGVRYARDIGEIHRLIVELAAKGDERNRAWDHVGLDDEGPEFRRIVLILEELSTTMDLLRDHWTDVREASDPATSPAIRALGALLNMGRAVNINVLAVAQRADAKTMGSGSMRENFSVRILAEYTPQTWKMLASECEFVPKSKVKGRAQVCIGSSATETQVIRMTDREAQAWVSDRRGMQPLRRVVVAPSGEAVVQGESTATVAGATTDQLPDGIEPVSLWDASSDKGRRVVTLRYDALRTDRLRHPNEFPEPIGRRPNGADVWDPRDLQRYEKNRPTYESPTGEKPSVEGTNPTEELSPIGRRDSRDRFAAMVQGADGDGCWLWTGAVDKDGYGQFRVDGRTVPAHRWAYEQELGPIPDGHTLDHLIGPGLPCTSKRCVRTSHLEPVTRAENTSRWHERQRATQEANTP